MYRSSAEETSPREADGNLVLEAKNRDRADKGPVALMQIFSGPAIVALVLTLVFNGTVGLIGMVASAVGGYLWWKKSSVERTTVRVLDAHVEFGDSKKPHRVSLGDLFDISLETKTVQPLQEGGSAIPAMRFLDAQVGPDVDTARLVFEIRGRRQPISLTSRYLAYGEATDWLGKVRVFLRKRGWEPLSERKRERELTETPEHDEHDEHDDSIDD